MFVVTSFRGHGKFLIADFDVDLAVGDGIWKKNICFGRSTPDENLLNNVGLTCSGSFQTENCDRDDLSEKEENHCESFLLLQGMESLAIFSTFMATFIGSLARFCVSFPLVRTALRLSCIVVLLLAGAASGAVIQLVKESDMVNERSFSCTTVMGAQLCHGYGASFVFQWLAVFEIGIALLLNALLLCVSPTTTSTSFQYVRVPLIQPIAQGGIIISAPNQQSQSQAAADMI